MTLFVPLAVLLFVAATGLSIVLVWALERRGPHGYGERPARPTSAPPVPRPRRPLLPAPSRRA